MTLKGQRRCPSLPLPGSLHCPGTLLKMWEVHVSLQHYTGHRGICWVQLRESWHSPLKNLGLAAVILGRTRTLQKGSSDAIHIYPDAVGPQMLHRPPWSRAVRGSSNVSSLLCNQRIKALNSTAHIGSWGGGLFHSHFSFFFTFSLS